MVARRPLLDTGGLPLQAGRSDGQWMDVGARFIAPHGVVPPTLQAKHPIRHQHPQAWSAYYTLGGRLIDELTGSPSPLTTNIFHTDPLGSIMATFNTNANSAALLGNQVYSPYGTQRYTKGSMGTNKGFTGQYNDSLTGLDFYNTRYYDPAAKVILPDNIILAYHDDQIRMLSYTPSSPKDR